MSLENLSSYEEEQTQPTNQQKEGDQVETTETQDYKEISFSANEKKELEDSIVDFKSSLIDYKRDHTDVGIATLFCRTLTPQLRDFLSDYRTESIGKTENKDKFKSVDHQGVIKKKLGNHIYAVETLDYMGRQLVQIEKIFRSTINYLNKYQQGINTSNRSQYEDTDPIRKSIALSIHKDIRLKDDQNAADTHGTINFDSINLAFNEHLVQAIGFCGGEYDPSEIILPDQDNYEKSKPMRDDTNNYYTQQQKEKRLNRQLDQYSN